VFVADGEGPQACVYGGHRGDMLVGRWQKGRGTLIPREAVRHRPSHWKPLTHSPARPTAEGRRVGDDTLGTLVLEGPARASGSWVCVLPVGSFDREAAGPDFGPPKCPDMHMRRRQLGPELHQRGLSVFDIDFVRRA
jgi:hypothetical protein